MDDDLRKIPQFIRLSRKTGAILKQNIVLALGIKAVFLVLAMTGTATLWMAVFADMERACWWCSTACGAAEKRAAPDRYGRWRHGTAAALGVRLGRNPTPS